MREKFESYDYKLKNRVERLIKNQGDRVYQIVTGDGSKMELCFYRDAKDVRKSFPDCRISRSRKMTENEMLAHAENVYSRMTRCLQYTR